MQVEEKMKWKKETINITNWMGEKKLMEAYCLNGLAIHYRYTFYTLYKDEWTITHIRTGKKVCSSKYSLPKVKAIAEGLLKFTNWEHLTSKKWGRLTKLKSEIRDFIDNNNATV